MTSGLNKRSAMESPTPGDDDSSTVSPTKKQKVSSDSLPKPKRPLTGYNRFYREERARWKKAKLASGEKAASGRDAFVELGKEVSAKWKLLNDNQKEKYQNEYEKELVQYRKDVQEYKRCLAGSSNEISTGGTTTVEKSTTAKKKKKKSASLASSSPFSTSTRSEERSINSPFAASSRAVSLQGGAEQSNLSSLQSTAATSTISPNIANSASMMMNDEQKVMQGIRERLQLQYGSAPQLHASAVSPSIASTNNDHLVLAQLQRQHQLESAARLQQQLQAAAAVMPQPPGLSPPASVLPYLGGGDRRLPMLQNSRMMMGQNSTSVGTNNAGCLVGGGRSLPLVGNILAREGELQRQAAAHAILQDHARLEQLRRQSALEQALQLTQAQPQQQGADLSALNVWEALKRRHGGL